MVHETLTSLPPDEVLAAARRFFAERVPNTAAFPEKGGPGWLALRGQGGEEVAISAAASGAGVTRVRASTLLFDQPVARFLSILPAPAESAA